MTEVDAEIPLHVRSDFTSSFDPTKMFSLAKMASELKQEKIAQQKQNALTSVFSSPDAYDPQTQELTPKAIKAITMVDPETGLSLRQKMLDTQFKTAQIKHEETETGAAT